MTQTLWVSDHQFFLVPTAQPWPQGSTTVWSPVHGTRQVEVTAWQSFVVEPTTARQRLQQEMQGLAGELQTMLTNFMEFATRANTTGNNPAWSQMGQLLNIPAEVWQHDPQQALTLVLSQLQQLAQAIGQPASTTPPPTTMTPPMGAPLPKELLELQTMLQQLDVQSSPQVKDALTTLNTLIEALNHQPSEQHPSHEALRKLVADYKAALSQQQAAANRAHYDEVARQAVEASMKQHMKPIDVKAWAEQARADFRREKKLS